MKSNLAPCYTQTKSELLLSCKFVHETRLGSVIFMYNLVRIAYQPKQATLKKNVSYKKTVGEKFSKILGRA